MLIKKLLLAGALGVSGCSFFEQSFLPLEKREADISILEAGGRKICHDILGVQNRNFNAGAASKYFDERGVFGTLDGTFGISLSPIRKILAEKTPSIYRVHFINGPGLRNRQPAPNEITKGFTIDSFNRAIESDNDRILGYLRERVLIYRELSKEFPDTLFLVSPMLEHNLTPRAYRILADVVKEAWPDVQLVNNQVDGRGERYRGSLIEHHGQDPRSDADITSLDGADVTDINVDRWLTRTNRNKITCVWSRSYNCRHQGTFEFPNRRRSCPKEHQVELLAKVTEERPPKPEPQFNCNFRAFDSTKIWKPMSEDKGTGDPRSNLPVAILKGSKSAVIVVGLKGRSVGKLTYYGNFEDGRQRYYSGHIGGSKKSGYQFEKEAMKQGSPWVWLKQGSICHGPFIPGRRAGSFR